MKKEPESTGEELEQLGPYQRHEQVPQDELRHRAVAPDKSSVEALMCLFESVREGVGRMAAAFSSYDEPRPWRRLGLALAGVATVCALVFVLVRMDSTSQPSGGPEPVAGAVLHEESVDSGMPESLTRGFLGDTTPQGELVFARPLPREPFKGQKRPPCNRRIEVELIGACWGPHELRAPCPDELYEHGGKCYLPIFSARPPPQALGR